MTTLRELELQRIHLLEMLETLDEIGKSDIHHEQLENELWLEVDVIQDKINELMNVFDQ